MSTGSQRIAGSLDFEEANPDTPAAGVSRLFRQNGLLRVIADSGGNGAILGGMPAQRMLDANATIAVADLKSLYFFPAGTVSAARTITISAAGPPANGWAPIIAVLGVQGFDILVRDDAATLLWTCPAGTKAAMIAFFNTGTAHALQNGWWFLP